MRCHGPPGRAGIEEEAYLGAPGMAGKRGRDTPSHLQLLPEFAGAFQPLEPQLRRAQSPLRPEQPPADQAEGSGSPGSQQQGGEMNPCPMNIPKKSGIAALQSHFPAPLAPLYPDECGFSSSSSLLSMLFVFSLSCAILCIFCVTFHMLYISNCIFHNSCAVFPVPCTFHVSYATFPILCIFHIFHVIPPSYFLHFPHFLRCFP